MIASIIHFALLVFGAVSITLGFLIFAMNISNVRFTFIDKRLWIFYTKLEPNHIYEGTYSEMKYSKMLIDFNPKKEDPF